MIEGKSNEKKLSFGDSPFLIYQNLAEFLNSEITKINAEQSNNNTNENVETITDVAKKINEIVEKMNSIDLSISNLPVFKCPEKTKMKAKRTIKLENGKVFTCELCNANFENGQGLGGHMSRTHPNSSAKFNKKKETREFRESKRNVLYEAKAKLLAKCGLDYNELCKTTEGKQTIRRIVKDNKSDYMGLRKMLKSDPYFMDDRDYSDSNLLFY